jgi:hypothetical protein
MPQQSLRRNSLRGASGVLGSVVTPDRFATTLRGSAISRRDVAASAARAECKNYQAWKKLPSRPARINAKTDAWPSATSPAEDRYWRGGGASAIPCGPLPTGMRLISR